MKHHYSPRTSVLTLQSQEKHRGHHRHVIQCTVGGNDAQKAAHFLPIRFVVLYTTSENDTDAPSALVADGLGKTQSTRSSDTHQALDLHK